MAKQEASVSQLVSMIEKGQIQLPEMQRARQAFLRPCGDMAAVQPELEQCRALGAQHPAGQVRLEAAEGLAGQDVQPHRDQRARLNASCGATNAA